MRVLIISSLFPPFILGGAEMAASSLATWLAAHGHEVCVLTSAPQPEQAGSERRADGVQIERRHFPNTYSVFETAERSVFQKAGWHFRDHFHRETEAICRSIIGQFRPDIVNTHDLQGIGYNLLREIGRQGLPCVQVLHDFGFLCVNMAMFHKGKTCQTRHLSCVASGWVKRGYLATIRRLSFWSPSEALLARYLPHLPAHLDAAAIPLPLIFSQPATRPATAMDSPSPARPRLLYVGQVIPTKGIDFLLRILARLSGGLDFELTVVGGGASLDTLRAEYAGVPWVKFTGRVAPEAVADFMAAADLMLIPSVWFENSPLVAYQAIQLGLPIFASDIGGLPELVRAGKNGVLLPPGDEARWAETLRATLGSPERLRGLRAGAEDLSRAFDPDTLGATVVQLFERTIAGENRRAAASLA